MTEETGRYRTPGELIAAARADGGLSLSDLATSTRIPERMLEALEQDDYETVSGPLYVRSFLKTLAVELELDADMLLERYERLAGHDDEGTDEEAVWETETRVERAASVPWRRILTITGSVVALIVVVWVGAGLFRGDDGTDDQLAAGTETPVGPHDGDDFTTVDPAADANDAAVEDDATADPVIDPGGPEDTGPDDEARQTDDDGVTVPPEPVPTTIPAGVPALEFSDGAAYPLVMRVVVEGPVGLSVAVDADDVLHAVDWGGARPGVPEEGVVAGRPYRVGGRMIAYWGARDHVSLILEEADGVTITLNGRPVPVPSRILGREWVLDSSRLRR